MCLAKISMDAGEHTAVLSLRKSLLISTYEMWIIVGEEFSRSRKAAELAERIPNY